jgi:hypothetical protein
LRRRQGASNQNEGAELALVCSGFFDFSFFGAAFGIFFGIGGGASSTSLLLDWDDDMLRLKARALAEGFKRTNFLFLSVP